jgi:hypothetical protein
MPTRKNFPNRIEARRQRTIRGSTQNVPDGPSEPDAAPPSQVERPSSLTDRRTLLDQRDKAYRLANNQDLPAEVRNLARQAADKADVLLGLQDARRAKFAKPDPQTGLPPEASEGINANINAAPEEQIVYQAAARVEKESIWPLPFKDTQAPTKFAFRRWKLSMRSIWHRKLIWGTGLLLIASVGYSLLPSPQRAVPALSQRESQCIESVSSRFEKLLARQSANSTDDLIQSITHYPPGPQLDAAMARQDFREKISRVGLNTAYCRAVAGCYASRLLKQTFDDCYWAMSDTSDGSDN